MVSPESRCKRQEVEEVMRKTRLKTVGLACGVCTFAVCLIHHSLSFSLIMQNTHLYPTDIHDDTRDQENMIQNLISLGLPSFATSLLFQAPFSSIADAVCYLTGFYSVFSLFKSLSMILLINLEDPVIL